MAQVKQIQGINFMEAFVTLKGGGQITETEGLKATAARSRIDNALKGNTSDLVEALKDTRALFQEAIEKNPNYRDPDGGANVNDWPVEEIVP